MSLIEHMQLDLIEEDETIAVSSHIPMQEVNETSLDLDTYINNYKDFGKYLRLIFIARRCRPLRLDALLMALQLLKGTWNFVEYCKVFNIIGIVIREDRETADSALAILSPGVCCREDFNFQRFPTRISYDPVRLPDGTLLEFDSDWVDRTRRLSNQHLDQLDTDLKNYKANNMAESIRRGCDELAGVHLEIGDLLGASKNYTRSRDYCKTDAHELAMCVHVIRVSVHLGHWRHVSSYLDRAQTLLDNITAQTVAQTGSGYQPTEAELLARGITPGSIPGTINTGEYTDMPIIELDQPIGYVSNERSMVFPPSVTGIPAPEDPNGPTSSVDAISGATGRPYFEARFNTDQKETRYRTKAMLHCVLGLLELHERNYSAAARAFLQAEHDHVNFSSIITANDVALYGTLCALATFDRNQLKTSVIQNTNFKQFLENDPALRDILHNFYNFQYADCLRNMAQLKSQILLDVYLADHVEFLYREIRNRALCQYFSPYKRVHLDRIAGCFNTTVPDLILELEPLIANGQLRAKIDTRNNLLVAAQSSPHLAVFRKAERLYESYQKRVKAAFVYNALARSEIYQNSSGGPSTSTSGPAFNYGDVQMEFQ